MGRPPDLLGRPPREQAPRRPHHAGHRHRHRDGDADGNRHPGDPAEFHPEHLDVGDGCVAHPAVLMVHQHACGVDQAGTPAADHVGPRPRARTPAQARPRRRPLHRGARAGQIQQTTGGFSDDHRDHGPVRADRGIDRGGGAVPEPRRVAGGPAGLRHWLANSHQPVPRGIADRRSDPRAGVSVRGCRGLEKQGDFLAPSAWTTR